MPACYGGFETAVEEIGKRLVARGHQVTVYCRVAERGASLPRTFEGMDLVHLPAARRRSVETLSHTALSVIHLLSHRRPDAVVVFNAANSVFLPFLRLRRLSAATHVDGLEWRRGKWGKAGKAYYRAAEALAVRWSDRLIADAQGISDYYADEFGASTDQIAYGAPILGHTSGDRIANVGCLPKKYHLVVARFEPENHVDMAIEGYLKSGCALPLVVVGSTPYGGQYDQRIRQLTRGQDQILMLGGVWDQDLLDELYANSLTYIHGHSVGGTNPSLLRAMGAAAPVVAYDVSFNRDVLGPHASLFSDAESLACQLREAEENPEWGERRGAHLARHAAETYTWDGVADGYEVLCGRLAKGKSQRGRFSGRRNRDSQWKFSSASNADSHVAAVE